MSDALKSAREALGRIHEWTLVYGAALRPRGADTYGNGVRDSKEAVQRMLQDAWEALDAAHEPETVAVRSGTLASVAEAVLACAESWEPDAMLLGNVTAQEVAWLARSVDQLRQQRDEAIGLLRLAQPIVEAHCDRKAKSATDHDGIKRAMDLGFAIFTFLTSLDAKKGAT